MTNLKFGYNEKTGMFVINDNVEKPSIRFAVNGYTPPQDIVDLGHVQDTKKKAGVNFDKDASVYEYPTYKQVREAGKNAGNLTQSEYVALEAVIVTTRVAQQKHRKLLPVDKVAPTNMFYQKVVETWGGSAEVVDVGVTFPEDSSVMAYTNIPILKYGLAVKIHREQYSAASLERAVRYLTRKVQEKEGQVCYESNTLPNVDGLIDDAGNSQAAGNVWSSAVGTALPLTNLQALAALMNVDGFDGPFTLCTSYDNWAEGHKRLENAGDGGIPFALSSGLIADAFWDPMIPTASPLLVQVGKDVAVLAVAEDLTVIVGDEDPSTQTRLVTCHIRSSPVIIQANGVGKVTSA